MPSVKTYRKILAPAKVNLILRIGPLRRDGFHNLESLMVPVTWGDEITLSVSRSQKTQIHLRCPGLNVPPEKNLGYRAAAEFLAAFRIRADVRMSIKKKVPSGAGLGGGSGDAAAVLRILAHWAKIKNTKKILKIASRLGSDVPVLTLGQPAWCTGRGEKLMPIRIPPLNFVIVVSPNVHVSTPWAYRELDRQRGPIKTKVKLEGMPNWLRSESWRIPSLENDFEELVIGSKPALNRVRRALAEVGAQSLRMSGSGSAFFGIFETPSAALRAAAELRRKGFRAFSCASLSSTII